VSIVCFHHWGLSPLTPPFKLQNSPTVNNLFTLRSRPAESPVPPLWFFQSQGGRNVIFIISLAASACKAVFCFSLETILFARVDFFARRFFLDDCFLRPSCFVLGLFYGFSFGLSASGPVAVFLTPSPINLPPSLRSDSSVAKHFCAPV